MAPPNLTIVDCQKGQIVSRPMTASEQATYTSDQQTITTWQQSVAAAQTARQTAIAALKAQAATNPLAATICAAFGW